MWFENPYKSIDEELDDFFHGREDKFVIHDDKIYPEVNLLVRLEQYLAGVPYPEKGRERGVVADYGLKIHSGGTLKGRCKPVFEELCRRFPAAKRYYSWNDLVLCYDNGQPLRAEDEGGANVK